MEISALTRKMIEENIMEIAAKNKLTDREKINKAMDLVRECSEEIRADVLAECKADPDARAYYVHWAEERIAAHEGGVKGDVK